MDKADTLVRSALAVLLEREGGTFEYTESEYKAVTAKHGTYGIKGEVDRSGPGEPRIRVSIVPTPPKAGARSDA